MQFHKTILTIDASGNTLVLELSGDAHSTYHRREFSGINLHELLIASIDNFLSDAGVTPESIGAIAVNQGPGNYSRLRVSLTWAKTASFYLKIPLMGYDSFFVIDNYLKRLIDFVSTTGSKEGLSQKSSDSLPDKMQRKILSLQSPLKVYFYRVSSTRFFSCCYWKGRRVGKVMALSSVPRSSFEENVNFLLGWSDLKNDNEFHVKDDILKWLENNSYEHQNSGRKDEGVFVLFDGGNGGVGGNDVNNDFDEIPSSSIVSLNALDQDLNRELSNALSKSDQDGQGDKSSQTFPHISLFSAVRETMEANHKKDFKEFSNGFLEVNPLYYREFGE